MSGFSSLTLVGLNNSKHLSNRFFFQSNNTFTVRIDRLWTRQSVFSLGKTCIGHFCKHVGTSRLRLEHFCLSTLSLTPKSAAFKDLPPRLCLVSWAATQSSNLLITTSNSLSSTVSGTGQSLYSYRYNGVAKASNILFRNYFNNLNRSKVLKIPKLRNSSEELYGSYSLSLLELYKIVSGFEKYCSRIYPDVYGETIATVISQSSSCVTPVKCF